MNRLAHVLIAVSVLLVFHGVGHAGHVLAVSTSSDPNHLKVGQAVTFNVSLSGITPGDSSSFLSYLAAAVGYNNALLSSFPSISAGAIVPDSTGFVGTGLASFADGFYDGVFLANSSSPISSNGVFFSFTLTPLKVGSGILSFDSAAATLTDDPDQNNQFTPETEALEFNIENLAVVPEPTASMLFVFGGLITTAAFRLRRLARR